MSQKYLGETIDIHGGGIDLVFPHHENELAQAEAISGKPLANYWMHNGYLNINGEKMSKSLNNFFTARDILTKYPAEAIRFFFLSKHYRSPIDFNEDIINESEKAVETLYSALKEADYLSFKNENFSYNEKQEKIINKFKEAMNDDINTAKAIAVLYETAKLVKGSDDTATQKLFTHLLVELGSVLGFFQNLESKLSTNLNETANKLIELFINYRLDAKKEKNWALADKIRDDLNTIGITLKDTPNGTDWETK